MTLFFNADFEKQIFSKNIKLESNKINQELEYFLFFLEREKVYTSKHYSEEYTNHVKSLGGEVLTTSLLQDITCWWSSYDDVEKLRKLNSKISSTKLAIENNLCHPETKIIYDISEVQDNFLYKDPRGFSGQGIFKSSEISKISNVLKQTPIVATPFLHRVIDISYLYAHGSEIIYQNLVDQFFQYKGTIIGKIDCDEKLIESFSVAAQIVKDFMNSNNALQVWSMDGFIYKDKTLKLYALCEINYRKTMGYITWKLHKKFNNNGVSQLLMVPNNKMKKQSFYIKEKNIFQLSPLNNKFITFLLMASDLEELNYINKKLIKDYF